MKMQDLKCCGNCFHRKERKLGDVACIKPCIYDEVCYNWTWDKKTSAKRIDIKIARKERLERKRSKDMVKLTDAEKNYIAAVANLIEKNKVLVARLEKNKEIIAQYRATGTIDER